MSQARAVEQTVGSVPWVLCTRPTQPFRSDAVTERHIAKSGREAQVHGSCGFRWRFRQLPHAAGNAVKATDHSALHAPAGRRAGSQTQTLPHSCECAPSQDRRDFAGTPSVKVKPGGSHSAFDTRQNFFCTGADAKERPGRCLTVDCHKLAFAVAMKWVTPPTPSTANLAACNLPWLTSARSSLQCSAVSDTTASNHRLSVSASTCGRSQHRSQINRPWRSNLSSMGCRRTLA